MTRLVSIAFAMMLPLAGGAFAAEAPTARMAALIDLAVKDLIVNGADPRTSAMSAPARFPRATRARSCCCAAT